MKFKDRLATLGFADYEDYLASDHWKAFKIAYKASGRPIACAVCSCRPIQLHHHTYARLGRERVDDVTPLCRAHHQAVHALLKEHGKFVKETLWAVCALAGRPVPEKPKKRRRRNRKAPVPGRPTHGQLWAEVHKIARTLFGKKKRKFLAAAALRIARIMKQSRKQ